MASRLFGMNRASYFLLFLLFLAFFAGLHPQVLHMAFTSLCVKETTELKLS